MGYLLYISHDAENLQFYLWFQDYSRRFFAASTTDQALSPLWDDDAAQAVGNDPGPGMPDKRPGLGTEFQFDFDHNKTSLDPMTGQQSFFSGAAGINPAHTVEVANSQTGLKWQSCESSMPRLIHSDIDARSHHPAVSLRNQQSHLPLPGSRITSRAQSLPARPHSMRKPLLSPRLHCSS